MDLMRYNPLLAMGQPPQSGQPQSALPMLVPMIIIMGGFLFISSRMQKKKQKEHADMLKSVRPGDRVVTTGGVIGVVVNVKEESVSVRSADSKIEVTKSAIAEIRERSGAAKES